MKTPTEKQPTESPETPAARGLVQRLVSQAAAALKVTHGTMTGNLLIDEDDLGDQIKDAIETYGEEPDEAVRTACSGVIDRYKESMRVSTEFEADVAERRVMNALSNVRKAEDVLS